MVTAQTGRGPSTRQQLTDATTGGRREGLVVRRTLSAVRRRLIGVNRVPPVLVYTVLRLLAFFVPLGVLLALRIEPWIAAVLSALIGLAVSFLLLRVPREKVAEGIYDRRHGRHTPDTTDEDAEDATT